MNDKHDHIYMSVTHRRCTQYIAALTYIHICIRQYRQRASSYASSLYAIVDCRIFFKYKVNSINALRWTFSTVIYYRLIFQACLSISPLLQWTLFILQRFLEYIIFFLKIQNKICRTMILCKVSISFIKTCKQISEPTKCSCHQT